MNEEEGREELPGGKGTGTGLLHLPGSEDVRAVRGRNVLHPMARTGSGAEGSGSEQAVGTGGRGGILKNGVYVDLAQNNDFSRLFVENMMFKLT